MRKPIILSLLVFLGFIAGAQQQLPTIELANKQYDEENYTEALRLFEKAQAESPQDARVPYLMAHVYADMNDFKNAAAYFEKAIALDSSRNNWIYECGLSYYAIPDYAKSLQFIELAGARGYKRTADYVENLANAYANTHQYAKAIELYKQVLEKKTSDQEIRYQLAQACFNNASYDDAITAYNMVRQADPRNADALYMIGLCYQKKGEKARGQLLCDQAIQMNPSLASKRHTTGGSL